MYNGLKEHSDDMQILLKELIEITDKYRRRLDSDRHDVISEFLDSKNEIIIFYFSYRFFFFCQTY